MPLDDEKIAKIRAMRADKASISEISARLKVSPVTVVKYSSVKEAQPKVRRGVGDLASGMKQWLAFTKAADQFEKKWGSGSLALAAKTRK